MTTTLDCGHRPSAHIQHTSGYGQNGNKTYCYDCIATLDAAQMNLDGHSKRLPLYLQGDEVTNWPGSLRFKVVDRTQGRHNIARTRVDVWFHDKDGNTWHGVRYGEMTDVVHCKRLAA